MTLLIVVEEVCPSCGRLTRMVKGVFFEHHRDEDGIEICDGSGQDMFPCKPKLKSKTGRPKRRTS